MKRHDTRNVPLEALTRVWIGQEFRRLEVSRKLASGKATTRRFRRRYGLLGLMIFRLTRGF